MSALIGFWTSKLSLLLELDGDNGEGRALACVGAGEQFLRLLQLGLDLQGQLEMLAAQLGLVHLQEHPGDVVVGSRLAIDAAETVHALIVRSGPSEAETQ